jgi:uncharacterized protein YbjT (DUF2867 family)
MADEIYVITGATGNIGSKIVNRFLKEGKKVRVIGRSADRLKPFADKGAEAFAGSVDDAGAMTKAFTGAKAVFVMIPPDLSSPDIRAYQNKVSESLATAITRSGVKYVVSLSSVGAHRPDKMGPVNGLYDNEQRLNQLKDVNVLHLRPSFFMENTLMNIGLIKQMGINGSPMKGDLSISMIATKDIAAVAVRHLLALDFNGKSVNELLGQRDLTMNEVTQVIGKAIDKTDLGYVQFPYEDALKAMVQMGISPSVASSFIEMHRSFNEGIFKPEKPRTAQNTTPTSIEEFAAEFARVYKGSRN